ncbi:MAG: hypothetical protein HZB65_02675 [Candidatus Aenigmarchaeota archaeon]|nr:hypothetical protein [Candidatus Aenigmarchaeota archaeon]
MNPMISYIMIVSIVVLGVSLVLVSGMPVIDKVKDGLEFQEAEKFMQKIGIAIDDVSREGEGSTRIVRSGSGEYRIDSRSDLIEFVQRSSVFDYLTRKQDNDLVLVSGTDARCYEQDVDGDSKVEMVMENSYIKIALKKASGAYNTKDAIVSITGNNRTIYPTDSSIIIDEDPATGSGIAASELDEIGTGLPKCRAHYFMNSTIDYDIYYTLYSGADFMTVEIRNIS